MRYNFRERQAIILTIQPFYVAGSRNKEPEKAAKPRPRAAPVRLDAPRKIELE